MSSRVILTDWLPETFSFVSMENEFMKSSYFPMNLNFLLVSGFMYRGMPSWRYSKELLTTRFLDPVLSMVYSWKLSTDITLFLYAKNMIFPVSAGLSTVKESIGRPLTVYEYFCVSPTFSRDTTILTGLPNSKSGIFACRLPRACFSPGTV